MDRPWTIVEIVFLSCKDIRAENEESFIFFFFGFGPSDVFLSAFNSIQSGPVMDETHHY
jgi:hypothetical protein